MNKQKFYIIIIILVALTFGTKALASLTFSTDAITGTSTSTIDVGSGHNLYLQTSGGNVGIGTTSPILPLHVNSSTTDQPARFDSSYGTSGSYVSFARSGTPLGYIGMDGGSLVTGNAQSTLTVRSNAALSLATGGENNRVFIDSTGNVGIGTGITEDTNAYTFFTLRVKTDSTRVDKSPGGAYFPVTWNPAANSTKYASGLSTWVEIPATNSVDSDGLWGASIGANHVGSGALNSIVGTETFAYNAGAGTATNMHAINAYWMLNGTARTTNASGITVQWQGAYDNSQVTNGYGIWVDSGFKDAGATLTNLYGMRIENQAAGANSWNFYSAGATSKNVFEGNVGIGTTAPSSKLQVVGLPVYANNAAAIAGGLTAGAFYRTGADPDPVMVVH